MTLRAKLPRVGAPSPAEAVGPMLGVWLGVRVAASLACVYIDGLPAMPAGSADDFGVYGLNKSAWKGNVEAARATVRAAPLSWTLVGNAGEEFASAEEIRSKYSGVILVGDSQIREVTWAMLQMLAPGQPRHGGKGISKHGLAGLCVPQSVGKTGFTATCGAYGSGTPCLLHSPFDNRTHAESMRKLLLTRPHDWDGKLLVSERACTADFFVSYQVLTFARTCHAC